MRERFSYREGKGFFKCVEAKIFPLYFVDFVQGLCVLCGKRINHKGHGGWGGERFFAPTIHFFM